MRCTCCIVPRDVLERLARESDLSPEVRAAALRTAEISAHVRDIRRRAAALTAVVAAPEVARKALAPAPAVTVYDCRHTETLPGRPVANPAKARDATAQRAFQETTRVADFYRSAFGRNSIDAAGMTMLSSIHYGNKFNNAMWNGSQMIYGDGDAAIFVDFTRGNDVIGHELTHGVTQYTLQLGYDGDAGGLNESLSDCFGAMFRQWEAGQDADAADWLIGHDILGPAAVAKGYTALRDMANPAAKHCLAPQPTKYSQLKPDTDPHYSSGPPNLAFCLACRAAGGKSWERVGQVWYRAMTGFGPNPRLTMKAFADRTRKLAAEMYPKAAAVATAVDKGWKKVGL